ncbi:MAG: hypothetical protein ACI9VR_000887 [Cognaticolwellia sp.]|jgi:hypothetical protein
MEAVLSILFLVFGCASPLNGFSQIDGVGTLGLSEEGSMYLCGDDSNTSESRWLVEQETGLWTTADGRWTLTLDSLRYELQDMEDNSWPGTLTPFDGGGLYGSLPDNCRSGAVLAQGQVNGTWCDGAGDFAQVEPVEPVMGSPESFVVHLATDTGKTFVMDRLP